MAWPKSPLTAYVANNVPVIKAADLNAFQDWINALTNNTVSILGLGIDSVGGNAVTPQPGAVKWTNTAGVGGAGNPTIQTPLKNEARALNVCKAWARVRTSLAGFVEYIDGANIFSVGCVAGQPLLKVEFAEDMADANYSVVATCTDDGAGAAAPIWHPIILYPSRTANFGPALLPAYVPLTNEFYLFLADGTIPNVTNVEVNFHVYGRQNS